MLIVDQDQPVRVRLAQAFASADYGVVEAGTFKAGQIALRARRPHVLVTEIRLGEFNGLQFLLTSDRPVPTVVLTASRDRALGEQARSLGAEVMVKPAAPRKLLQIVDRLIRETERPTRPTEIRRWVRREPRTDLVARFDDRPARVLNVSYGGLCVEMERPPEDELPRAFRVSLPMTKCAVEMGLVWAEPVTARAWRCGVVVAPGAESLWYGVVDAIA